MTVTSIRGKIRIMKDKNAAAQELGRLSAKRFANWTKEEKSKYFKEIRSKRETKVNIGT